MPIPVKLTRAHQITLPKRLLEKAGWLDYEFFIADLEGDRLVLVPLTIDSRIPVSTIADLRRHFARLGITQEDVGEAIRWARSQAANNKRHRLRR